MITRKLIMHMTCVAFATTATVAWAEDSSTPASSFTLGVGVQNAPKYSGSDKRHTLIAPVIQARDGAFFFDGLKGIGYDLQGDNGLYLEHTLGYSLGRTEKDSTWRDGSKELKGMGSIKAVMNTSVAVGWQATSWFSLEGKATLPLTDGQGGQYQASLTVLPWQDETDTVALQSAALFGDSRYMQTFYGVNSAQSERSGYARYQPGGGFYGINTNLTWSHQFSPHWATVLIGGYTWLDDHAADSPIVFRRNQATASAALLYTF